jgi:hypothetical protein
MKVFLPFAFCLGVNPLSLIGIYRSKNPHHQGAAS